MKSLFLSTLMVVSLVAVSSVRAEDVTVKITNTHMCCDSCVKGADKAVSTVPGVTDVCDKEGRTIVLTAPNKATAQKAVNALTKAGYYGECTDPDIKIHSAAKVKGAQLLTMKLEDVHLCCPKCVKAVNAALKDCPGVTTNTATKGAKTFEVTGNFKDSDVIAALQKEGLTGKIVK